MSQLLAELTGGLGNTVAVCRKSYVHPRVLALLTGAAPDRREKRPNYFIWEMASCFCLLFLLLSVQT